MNQSLLHLTDRELLELIYMCLLLIYSKVKEIDNDDKLLGMNIFANIVGDMLMEKRV